MTPPPHLARPAGRSSPLIWLALLVAVLVSVPIFSVGTNLFLGGTGDTWQHLAATVLPSYVLNTVLLCLGVSLGVMVIGIATAWLVSVYDFPGRAIFEWALVLPLAVPAYVMAYTYTDLLQFVGPLQTWLRESWGLRPGGYWFPNIRSIGGAISVFIFVLYPYVYLVVRTAFLERASNMLEVGQSLGLKPWRSFFRISLPLARPAVAAGTALALMETLADYGAVSYFGVQTFTTGIYRAWFSLGDHVAAAQLAASLLGVVILLLFIERGSRGRARFGQASGRQRPAHHHRLRGAAALSASLACLLPLTLGFLIPAGTLLYMALTQGDAQFGERFFHLARNSFVLAAVTALIAISLSLLLCYAARGARRALPGLLNRGIGLGYAFPGSVIAVGVLIPVAQLDRWLDATIYGLTGNHPGLLLTGGIAALVYAYLVRFLTVSLQSVEASMTKITPSMDDAARSLGLGRFPVMWRVHLPLLRGSLLTGALMVFVDVMKELPATLVMRPFNFDTLATQAFTLASDERLGEASTAALSIVAVGVIPLIFISRQIARGRQPKSSSNGAEPRPGAVR